MSHVLRSITFVIVVATVGVCSAAAQGRNSITGFVFSEGRAPVERVYVELQTDLYSTVARTQTNGAGMFAFRGLPEGQYSVRVLPTGTDYEGQSRSVSLIPMSAIPGRGAVSEQVDFYLRARRRGNPLAPPEVVFVQEVPQKAKELYEQGIEELDKKKNEAAGIGKLIQALEAFPDYFAVLNRLGDEYLRKSNYEASHLVFAKAVELNPRSISGNLGLGVSEYRLNRVAQSVGRFEAVIKLHKENANAHYWLGIAYHTAGKLREALNALQTAAKLSDERSPEVQWQLARVYKDQKKFKESADALELYLKLKPDAENAAEIRKVIITLREKKAS